MKHPCEHWSEAGDDRGRCAIKHHGTAIVCGPCWIGCKGYAGQERTEAMVNLAITLATPSRGFGDTLNKAITTATGGKRRPCGLCQKIESGLNKAFSYA